MEVAVLGLGCVCCECEAFLVLVHSCGPERARRKNKARFPLQVDEPQKKPNHSPVSGV